MLFRVPPTVPSPLRAAIHAANHESETTVVQQRLDAAALPADMLAQIDRRASDLVAAVRQGRVAGGGIDAFLQEYDLTSQEGVMLMCLAEALLRVPDAETADRLIKDKIGGADWEKHIGHADSWFVNASTWALMLTGQVLHMDQPVQDWRGLIRKVVAKSGEPVIRQAVTQAMRIMGQQFVMGRTIDEALTRAKADRAGGYRHSFDMLGEAARTMADAERYFDAYSHAIAAVGSDTTGTGPEDRPGISVKLSALHPRYEFAKRDRVMAELLPRIVDLAGQARDRNIGLTVDAEEADRLDLSLDVFEALAREPGLKGWQGLGLAVQAYQKRALPLIDWLADLARSSGHRLMVRLVKGAYWDSEIKLCQVEGRDGYPVFTRKVSTDVSYIACAKRMIAAGDAFYPAFATHNAHTVATILALADGKGPFEFQRLHGMGEPLYERIVGEDGLGLPCRIYAPVGSHEELLAYLVRRLLENGANTSFVNRIVDERLPVSDIVRDPIATLAGRPVKPHPDIALPRDIYGPARANARGVDLHDPVIMTTVAKDMATAASHHHFAQPLLAAGTAEGAARPVTNPADRRQTVGEVVPATPAQAAAALDDAVSIQPAWNTTPATERAKILRRAATLYEDNMPDLMGLAVREAGKTMLDAVAEVREAVDFLRYYALRAETEFAGATVLTGPTGEDNRIALHGRGTFLCISPWNFPLAIFTGQISAALAAGNAVLAKPAEQTPLMAHRAVQLLHEAGVPEAVLQLLPGDGAGLAAPLLSDPRLGGVAFTGSTATAQAIHRALAARDGPILPLIAETGGQNAMIVDSTALPEQVTRDVLASAFQSAGQRCSALRVLFLQADIADRQLDMIAGAMAELQVGDPAWLDTDVGPVIDDEARVALDEHRARMAQDGRVIYEHALADDCAHGTFVAPSAYEIERIDQIGGEQFGPILHVVRYEASALDQVIDTINDAGFGLTLGIHSRIQATVDHIVARARVGNIYVNRNQIGAVVGVQPFGGEGLSGTGPKAGGPHYLHRFAVERVVSTDTTAVGGNASLLALDDVGGES